MGIFDRRREPEPEPAPPQRVEPQLRQRPASGPAPAAAQPAAQSAAQARPATQRSNNAARGSSGDFGIQKAMELMRNLPADNVELVVEVVRKTLESANVDVAKIITDASDKQDNIEKRIARLKEEIADYREEIAGREEEISGLQADYSETKSVKDRLLLAMKPKPKIMQNAAKAASGNERVPTARMAPKKAPVPEGAAAAPLLKDPAPKPPNFD